MSSDYRNEVKYMVKEGQWTFWKIFWPAFFIIVILGMISWLLIILSRPAQVIERVTKPDRIIQNYEWFEETYNDALALNRKIETAQLALVTFEQSAGVDREKWTRADRNEHGRLNSILQGLRNQRDDVISEYNAKSNLLTRSLFKGSALPYQLNVVNDLAVEVWEE